MADYLKKRPMLLCAAVSAVLCIVGFYCPPAVFFCGIALIILFFVSLYTPPTRGNGSCVYTGCYGSRYSF